MNRKERIKLRSQLYKKQKCRCFWCGELMLPISITHNQHDRGATLEHVLPKRFGGVDNESNIVLAHKGCNHKRDLLMGS